MVKEIFFMDTLAIQRSLAILEDRFRELREIGENHLAAWDAERTALNQQIASQTDSLKQARKAQDGLVARLDFLQAELDVLKTERHSASIEMDEAQKIVADLQHLLATQSDSLQRVEATRDNHALQLKVLEGRLDRLMNERQVLATALHRLRFALRLALFPATGFSEQDEIVSPMA